MAEGIPENLSWVLTQIGYWFLVPTSREPPVTPSKSVTTISAKMSFLQALITSELIGNSIHGKLLRIGARYKFVRQTTLSG
jgi:hypothetical protein